MSSRTLAVGFIAALLAQAPVTGFTASVTWVGGNGFWEDSANWDVGAPPTGADFATTAAFDISSTLSGNIANELLNFARLNVSSGNLTVNGTITNKAGASVMTSTGGVALATVIQNEADAFVVSTDSGSVLTVINGIFNSGRVRASNDGVINGGSFENSAVLDAITGGDVNLNGLMNIAGASAEAQGAGSTINVAGGINNQAGAKVAASLDGVILADSLDNSGQTLALSGGEMTFNSLSNKPGGQVEAQGAGSSITVTGAMTNQTFGLIAASVDGLVAGGSLDNSGETLALSGGDMYFNGISNISGGRTEAQGSGSTVNVSGSITNQGGATLAASEQGMVSADSLDNSGQTLALSGGEIHVNSLLNTSSGNVQANGTNSLIEASGTAHNLGLVEIVNGGKLKSDAYIQDDGITLLNNGTLHANNVEFNLGSLQGEGNVVGNTIVDLNAIIAPGLGGSDAGLIDIAGDFNLNGTALFEIGGLVDFDIVDATGALTLGGSSTLMVSLFGGYTPVFGDTFDILFGSTRSGTFANLFLPVLGGGLVFDVNYLGDRVQLEVVPLPPSVWLMLSALLGVTAIGMNRRMSA